LSATGTATFSSVPELAGALAGDGYVADAGLATALFLALRLERPLFLEGEAGVGKTELAKVTAAVLDAPLIRLQCYEGLDIAQAAYEWNYTRQMLAIRLAESGGVAMEQHDLFGPEFLLRRPLLHAIETSSPDRRPVLLIDEVDRSDEEFEAYLLEVLSDFQITIPEIGTIRADAPPVVVLTSNRTREVHDALKRRCLYHWIPYPSYERELEIVRGRVPQAAAQLASEATRFAQELRELDLFKRPGVSETLDWTMALASLGQTALDEAAVDRTLGALLKYRDDLEMVRGERAGAILTRMAAGAP
jgi:MoxR-like ATPase